MACEHSATETPDHAFDATADFEVKVHIFHFSDGEGGDPAAEFRGDFVGLRMFFQPLDNAGIDARSERFHEIVSQRRGALAGHMGNAKRGVETNGEKLLQNGAEQDGVTVVEELVETTFVSSAIEGFDVQVLSQELPIEFGADGFFVGFATEGRRTQSGARFPRQ